MELVRVGTRPVAVGGLRAAYDVLSDAWRRWRRLCLVSQRRVAAGTALIRRANRRRRFLLRSVLFALQTEKCISIHKSVIYT